MRRRFLSQSNYIILLLMFSYCLNAQVNVEFELTEPSCFGFTDGKILASVSGGMQPYTISWNTGADGLGLLGIGSGTYIFNLSDANNTSFTDTIFLSEPTEIISNLDFVGSVCINAGDIEVEGAGGTPPFSYLWEDGITQARREDLPPGFYCVTLTDANNCESVDCITVPSSLEIAIQATPPACPGGCDASAVVNINGGTTPYTILWSNGATTTVNTYLLPGTYSVTVADANGCVAFETVTVPDGETDLSVTVTGTNPLCEGDGSASALATGGVPPYSFYWNNGQSGQVLENLISGTYIVTVTDALGCKDTSELVILADNDLSVTATIDFSCGDQTAVATAAAVGGTEPYTFEWTNGDFGTIASNLTPGEVYQVLVTDADGCEASQAVSVSDIEQVAVTIEGLNPSCNGFSDGMVTAIVEGDPNDYTFFWNGSQRTQSVGFLGAGTYSVSVFDAEGCGGMASITLVEPNPLSLDVEVTNAICGQEGSGSAIAIGMGGTPPYTYFWSTSDSTALNDNLPAGMYTVVLRDAGGCEMLKIITIEEESNLDCTASVIHAVSGTDQSDGSVGVVATGGSNYTYLWSDGQTSQVATELVPGEYFVTVTDDSGCITVCSVLLEVFICINLDDPGEICCDQEICGPGVDPAPILNAVSPSGGEGELEYLWMMSTTEAAFNPITWVPIPNSNTPDYDPGPVFETTYFARCARIVGCPDYLETEVVKVEVQDVAVAEIIGPSEVICVGDEVIFSALDNGEGANYSWDFGPNATPRFSDERSVSVIWNNFGPRTIKLMVEKDACSSVNYFQTTITDSPVFCDFALRIEANPHEEGAIEVNWHMRTGQAFSYEVERSKNGKDFIRIGITNLPSETRFRLDQFDFMDKSPLKGNSYYRVKFMDARGNMVYSNVAPVSMFNEGEGLLIYPNPFKKDLTVEFLEENKDAAPRYLNIRTSTGALVKKYNLTSEDLLQTISLADLPSGIYFIRIWKGDQKLKSAKMIKME